MTKLKLFLREYVFVKRMLDVCVVLIAVGLGTYLKWQWTDIGVFGIFIWMILNPFPSKYPTIIALTLLVLTPVFLTILKQKVVAEELAVNAFYFLAMAVIMAMYELRQGEHNSAENAVKT